MKKIEYVLSVIKIMRKKQYSNFSALEIFLFLCYQIFEINKIFQKEKIRLSHSM